MNDTIIIALTENIAEGKRNKAAKKIKTIKNMKYIINGFANIV